MKSLSLFLLVLFLTCPNALRPSNQEASLREEPLCVENSPERGGEIGCSIVENKPLPTNLKEPVFWHIDRFEIGERARAAMGLQVLRSRPTVLGGSCQSNRKATTTMEANMLHWSNYRRYQRPPNIQCW